MKEELNHQGSSSYPEKIPPSYNDHLRKEREFHQEYWSSFNRFGKILGYAFMFGGFVGFLILALYFLDPALFPENPEYDASFHNASSVEKTFGFVAFAIVSLFGFLLTKAKPSHPK